MYLFTLPNIQPYKTAFLLVSLIKVSGMSVTSFSKELQYPVLVDGVRTPFMRSQKAYMNLSSFDLGRLALNSLLSKLTIPADEIDHVIMGTVLHDPRTPNIARECVLGTSLSHTIPAATVSLACISSNVATTQLADMISMGRVTAGIVGGVDTCSDPPIRVSKALRKHLLKLSKVKGLTDFKRLYAILKSFKLRDLSLDVPKVEEFSNGKTMGQGAEILAQEAGVSRTDSDAFAFRSHQNAVKAWKEGIFDDHVIPVCTLPGFDSIVTDDGPRADTTLDSLKKLRPAFDKQFGVCTAGNSSFLTDGASSLLMMSYQKAQNLGIKPKAIIKDYVYRAGDALTEMLSGPALSIPFLLKQNGLQVQDIDVWEIHEAFSSQVLANLTYLSSPKFAKDRLKMDSAIGEIPMEKINVWGGSLSLGHPFGATGCRLLYTAAKRLQKEGAKFAVVSGCAAGGHGSAI